MAPARIAEAAMKVRNKTHIMATAEQWPRRTNHGLVYRCPAEVIIDLEVRLWDMYAEKSDMFVSLR